MDETMNMDGNMRGNHSYMHTDSRRTLPKLSIGLPVYNGEQYLHESVESILAQDFDDFELLISDNASTDGTWRICQEYEKKDPRIRLYRHATNAGALSNFAYVFENTFSPYFMWHAHDDLRSPTTLSSCIAFLDGHPDFVLCSTRNTIINHRAEFLHPCQGNWQWDDDDPVARLRKAAACPTYAHAIYGVFRRGCLQKLLPLPYVEHSADGILMLIVALAGKCGHVKEAVRLFRPPQQRPDTTVIKSPRETVEHYRRQMFGDCASFKILPTLSERRVMLRLISQMPDLTRSQKAQAIGIARRHPDFSNILSKDLPRLFREAISYAGVLYEAGRWIHSRWRRCR